MYPSQRRKKNVTISGDVTSVPEPGSMYSSNSIDNEKKVKSANLDKQRYRDEKYSHYN
jgi:hypothetical protein